MCQGSKLTYRSTGGKLVFHVFGALAEFERDLIRERTHAGLAAARARGRLGGQTDVGTICATLGISRATLYRALKTGSK